MDLLTKYQKIRERTVALCTPLKTEDYVPQPVVYTSPPKWHLAHTTWFFEEMVLSKYDKSYQRFHPEYAFLFNSYYNTIGERTLRADRGNITRPVVDEVYAYRKYVDDAMQAFISGSRSSGSALNIIELGLNHEQQHQELLVTDLKFMLGHNPTFPVYDEEFKDVSASNKSTGWISFAEGIYEIGSKGDSFCFDNELNQHKVYLHDFEISQALATNGEFLEFIEDEGYSNFNFWLDEGWAWLQNEKINSPLYWHKIEGSWHYYTLGGLKKIELNEPLCHISYYEAHAFAAWKGMRLPTEFEWETASNQLNWGQRWEWTNSAYLPYPGFKIASGAVGEYNGKFMVNQMVLRGASAATANGHSRPTYRNFFHPHYQWQYSGIRLAK